jgi:hypothetical protein
MGRSLDDFSGVPSLKLRGLKDHAIFAIAHAKIVEQKDINDPTKTKLKDDGTPAMQEVLRVIYLGGTAVFTDDDNDVPCVIGDQYDLYVNGKRRWDFSQAKKTLRKETGRGLEVGDVCKAVFASTLPSKFKANPIKVWTFALRHPKADEKDLAAQCDAIDEAMMRSGDRAAPRGRPMDREEEEGGSHGPPIRDESAPYQDDDIPF